MIDLHTHSIFSDGVLIPAELVRRADVKGYKAIAITDHADSSNIDFIIPRLVKVAAELSARWPITVIPGVEITHVPPPDIARLVAQARALGAKLVVLHGETPVEPVSPGTNRAGINAGVDILAHPGLITRADAALAAKKGVHLEVTARKGHSLTNGHVVKMAVETGAKMVINTDTHEPGDMITVEFAVKVLAGAGLDKKNIEKTLHNSRLLVDKITGGAAH